MARVCMVAFSVYPGDTRIRREAEALADRGDEVDVICLRREGDESAGTYNGVCFYRLPLGRYRGSSAARYLGRYLLFFFAASFKLTTLHLRKRYDVIQVHTMPDFMVFVAVLPRLLGAKIVLDVHDLMPELYRSKYQLQESHWLVRFITWVERCSVGFADRAIAVHQPHLGALVKHGNPEGKFTVLLNLADPKVFSRETTEPSRNGHRFTLVYHGLIEHRHGLRVALRALARVKDEIEDVEFQLFGGGDDLGFLTDLAVELGLNDCVTFGGSVPIADLVPVLRDADVGVVPLLCDDFTKYMLPVKLLEYVALGIPVVCSRTDTIKAYFDSSMVCYVEPGDADDLARKLVELYRHPEDRARLAVNADRFNLAHSWEQEKKKYYQLVDELNHGSRSRETV